MIARPVAAAAAAATNPLCPRIQLLHGLATPRSLHHRRPQPSSFADKTHRCSFSIAPKHLRNPQASSFTHVHRIPARSFRSSAFTMAKEYKLKDVAAPLKLASGQLKQVEVEGVEGGAVLLSCVDDKVYATGTKCTHYGLPLIKGVLGSTGRLTCAFHGACFDVKTGDLEDAPAIDPLVTYEIVEKDGSVYVKGEESDLKNGGMGKLNAKCTPQGKDHVVVIGAGPGSLGVIEGLRQFGFKGAVTVISTDGARPFDRTKLSKALKSDLNELAWRDETFYKDAGIQIVKGTATSVDFTNKTVSTDSGQEYSYTKLVLASGGTPRSLPLPGLKEGELKNVFLIRDLNHTKAINAALGEGSSPKKVVVVGSSFIGLEVANALATQKHDVSVIGMENAPAELVFGTEVGNVFRGLLEKNGIKFYLGASVDKATANSSDSSRVGAVHLKDGTALEADIVIEGVGVRPATDYLQSAKPFAPELLKDGSLAVDDTLSVKGLSDVYAIGDIATYPYNGQEVRIEHWDVAQNHGRNVARTLAGLKPKPFVPVFWSALGAGLRYCGNTKGGYDDVLIKGETSPEKPALVAYYTRGDTVLAVATINKDPLLVKCAELMRNGTMPGKKDIDGGLDILTLVH